MDDVGDKKKTKARYNLELPQDLYAELQQTAKAQGVSTVTMLRKFIMLGLTLVKIAQKSPDASFVIREGDNETRILLF